MRKIIGIGETILDILFKGGVAATSVPGGSTFNSMISLGRVGVPACFVSEIGDDKVGGIVRTFLTNNGVDDHYLTEYPECKSPISLAFLDANNNATYSFYKEPFGKRTEGGFKGKSQGSNTRKPFGKSEGGYKGKSEGGYKGKSEGGYKGKPRTERKSYPKFNPNKQTGEVRLNRFVAQSGICSRREADELITAGLVSVNGVIVTELGTKVMPGDEVRFNGEKIQGEQKVYLILNKPKGYVTTIEDDHAAKTVMELVAGACTERIYPVGRLDKNSLGLLLFTNDGDITRTLTHPSLKKKKIYEVTLDKALTRADFDTLAEGVDLEDGAAYFDEISWLKDDKKSVGVEIHSGRNRIVRRMFEHLGYQVTKLDRVYYAGLTKKNLKRGAWRFLTVDEVNRLKSGRYE